jgi:hypothetical protein
MGSNSDKNRGLNLRDANLPTKMQTNIGSTCINVKSKNKYNPNGIIIGSNESSDNEQIVIG